MPLIRPAPGRIVVVHAKGRQLGQFQKGRAGVQQQVDALARQQLATGGVFVTGFVAAAQRRLGDFLFQVIHQRTHLVGIGLEVWRAGRVWIR
jgi:hypothetical protein